MSKSKRYKTIIEIEHSNFKDASVFLHSLRADTLKQDQKKKLGDFSFSIMNRMLEIDVESFENAKEEIINGNRCLVFQSKMNKDE